MQKLREYLPPDEVDCVVYHSPCSDGFAGAWVFWKYLKEIHGIENHDTDERFKKFKFIQFSHMMSEKDVRAKIIPEITDRNVVFIDVCPSEPVFLDMIICPERAIVLDHHESALKTTEKFPADYVFKHCHIDQTHSGCMLAHQYCYPDDDPSLFLRCIEDRDIWAWKLSDTSRPFTEAFHKSVPFDFEAYSVFEDEANVNSLVEEGKVLMKYKDARIMDLVKKAREGEITIDGKNYAVYMINTAEHISDLGHVLSQTDCQRLERTCDFALMWYYDERRGKIKVSLRSDGDREKEKQINVSEIARYFGGGGHPNASGFTIDSPELFLTALNTIVPKQNLDDSANPEDPENPASRVSFKQASYKKSNNHTNTPFYYKKPIPFISGVLVGGAIVIAAFLLGRKSA